MPYGGCVAGWSGSAAVFLSDEFKIYTGSSYREVGIDRKDNLHEKKIRKTGGTNIKGVLIDEDPVTSQLEKH